MPWFRHDAHDSELLDLYEAAGRNVEQSCRLLRRLLAEFPERPELAGVLTEREHEGDRITHDIIHRLNAGSRGRPDAAELRSLASALDDIVDYAEQTADMLGLYGVEAPMDQAVALADVLVGAGEQVARAVHAATAVSGRRAAGAELSAELVEIHRLENEGDQLARQGVASLFATGIDPMLVIRWKDIFNSLEQAVDACETVADILEGLELTRQRR